MPKIDLLGAAPIDGEMRYPSQGPFNVSPKVAEELERAGLARIHALDKSTVDELRDIIAAEAVDVSPTAKKDDLIAAIRAKRAGEG